MNETNKTNTNAAETVTERIARLNLTDISETRLETLTIAHPLVDDAVFAEIGRAVRVSRKLTIVLPSHRYEHLSRGRGWCRQGKGGSATWGERTDDGNYRVGPGAWSVGATDGFRRKAAVEWVVAHVRVGEMTWTIAN